MEIFEKASRMKLRFDTSKGQLSTEDLWGLSLQSLDTIAKATNKKLKEDSEESFISARSTTSTVLDLQMDILKHVIAVKLAEKDAAALRAEKRAKLDQLKTIYAAKQNEQLSSKSLEDIEKLMAELRED